MNKPNSYDEVKAAGDFTPVELGGHHCIIKQVSETTTKNGAPMIVVLFDFAPNDKQPGYFRSDFESNLKEDKKWPFQGTKWILVNDYKDPGKTSRNFKTFCSCVEKSNPGFSIAWGDNWGKQFVNKKIGAVYGIEEHEYDGNIYERPVMKWFCADDAATNASIPEPKRLPRTAVNTAPAETYGELGDDEELPF